MIVNQERRNGLRAPEILEWLERKTFELWGVQRRIYITRKGFVSDYAAKLNNFHSTVKKIL